MINFKFVRFTFVVYVSHKVNVLVTDIILNITSQEHLIFTSLHIRSRLFELFSKEVCVQKQPGMPLKDNFWRIIASGHFYLLVGSISCERSYCLFNPIRLLYCPDSRFWRDPLSVRKIDSLRAPVMLILSFDDIETCMIWQLIVSALYLSQPLWNFYL